MFFELCQTLVIVAYGRYTITPFPPNHSLLMQGQSPDLVNHQLVAIPWGRELPPLLAATAVSRAFTSLHNHCAMFIALTAASDGDGVIKPDTAVNSRAPVVTAGVQGVLGGCDAALG